MLGKVEQRDVEIKLSAASSTDLPTRPKSQERSLLLMVGWMKSREGETFEERTEKDLAVAGWADETRKDKSSEGLLSNCLQFCMIDQSHQCHFCGVQ